MLNLILKVQKFPMKIIGQFRNRALFRFLVIFEQYSPPKKRFCLRRSPAHGNALVVVLVGIATLHFRIKALSVLVEGKKEVATKGHVKNKYEANEEVFVEFSSNTCIVLFY